MFQHGIRRASVAVGTGYLLIRFLFAFSTKPASFGDTGSYTLAGTRTVRPYGISAIFDVAAKPAAIVFVQTLIGTVCVLWLMRELARRSGVVAVVAGLLTLLTPFLMWDRLLLSESLSFGCIAAMAAATLRWVRLDRRVSATAILVVSCCVSALIREPVFLIFGIPLLLCVVVDCLRSAFASRGAVSTGVAARRSAGIAAALGLVFLTVLFSQLALRPSRVIYDPGRGVSLENFRTMNIIGQRILPDSYLRSHLEPRGLPKTAPEDQVNRFAMDSEWRLYAIPGMTEYANNFSTARYLLAELSRPTDFYRYATTSVDAFVFEQTLGYRGDPTPPKMLPSNVERLVVSWSGTVHLALVAICLLVVWARRDRSLALGSALVALLSTVGAVLAATLDAMERQRHALPFLVAARYAVVMCFAAVVISILKGRRNPSPAVRSQSAAGD